MTSKPAHPPPPCIRVQKKTRIQGGRASASHQWLHRHLNDGYVRAAKREGYRSRAAYKLLELHKKHQLFKPGQWVIDLGAAPGGWSQVAANLVQAPHKGQVIGLDLQTVDPLEGVIFIHGDFMDTQIQSLLSKTIQQPVTAVLSDMAPPTKGHAATDHLKTIALAEEVVEFLKDHLCPGGFFLCKIFMGSEEPAFKQTLKTLFEKVSYAKPPASRKNSPEIYILAQGFKGKTSSS